MAKLDDYKDISPEQVEVHEILTNLRMKVRVTNCVLIAFFVILAFLFCLMTFIKSSWQEKSICGALDAILSLTMGPLVKHYFPAVKNAIKGGKQLGAKKANVKKIGGSSSKEEVNN